MEGRSSMDSQVELLKEAAKVLYEKNLSALLDKIRVSRDQRVIYRVEMDSSGIITSCIKCPRIERPRPNTFLFIVPEHGKAPVFCSFRGLEGHQVAIACALKGDIERLVQTNEIAYCLSQAAPSAVVESGMRDLLNRFGELPVAEKQVLQWKESANGAAKKEAREELVKSIPSDVFEQFVDKERRRMDKRRHRRAMRKLCDYGYKHGQAPSPLISFTYRYFSYHYLLNNKRYQFIQVYTQPQSQGHLL